MARINPNYDKLPNSYLFPEIGRRIKEFAKAHPEAESKIIRLHIGNIRGANSIPSTVLEGLRRGVEICGSAAYKGYGDEQGEEALRKVIAQSYLQRGVNLDFTEVFVSDGAKCDAANISSIFSPDSVVAVQDPVYPVYLDTNILTGKGGSLDSVTGGFSEIIYMPCNKENSFWPGAPKQKTDLIYWCSPNNPTGEVSTHAQLQQLVDFAREHKSIIIFDAAYSSYISDPQLPRTIYETEGAKECAIEINSFSKSVGFTGVRLGWTVVPKELVAENSEPKKINTLWNRRQATFFNGASVIAQEGGLAALTEQGQRECQEKINGYMTNARTLRAAVEAVGLEAFGGINAPYVYARTPRKMKSWDTLDFMLENAQISVAPGAGFGLAGEGYFRLSSFDTRERTEEAAKRIRNLKL